MKKSTYNIEAHNMLTEDAWKDQLELLSNASHALLRSGLEIGKTCNHPDMTVLQQACGFLEIAAHNARVFLDLKKQEEHGKGADQIVFPKLPVQ